MVEIIPADQLKIIKWPKSERLVVCKRTKKEILFVGLDKYIKGIKTKKEVSFKK